MKRPYWLIVASCALGLLFAVQAPAQQHGYNPQKAEEAKRKAQEAREKAQEARQEAQEARKEAKSAELVRASNLRGMEVRSRDNQDLGKIDDLVIDSKTGQISYVAISPSSTHGKRNNMVAVPWKSLQLRTEGGRSNKEFLVLNVQKGDFEKAPTFSSKQWPTSQDQIWQVGAEQEQMDVNVEQHKQPGHQAQPSQRK